MPSAMPFRVGILVLMAASTATAQSGGTFTATGAMTIARSSHTATLLNTGKVLIAGGAPDFNSPTGTAELYDPLTGTFTRTGDMVTPRSFHTASLLPDGRVLIAGGYTGTSGKLVRYLNTAEIYDPSTGKFSPTGQMVNGHECAQAELAGTGEVFLSGGSVLTDDHVPDAEFYDAASGSFSDAGKYVTDPSGFNSCQGAASTLLPDGKALIVWEEQAAEIYDPDSGSFSETGKPLALSYNDGLPTATLLMNGKVLVAGGADDTGIHKSAEIFDPSTGHFTATGNMADGHALHSATLLPNGAVLIAGSYLFGGGATATTELYNPFSGIFSIGPQMLAPRCCHTATLLNDGRVLIAGGNSPATVGAATSLAEIYTPDISVPAPVLLTIAGDATGQGAILHAGTSRLVTAADPATAGEALEIYCTGLGGSSAIPPQVAIAGTLAPVLYFGQAPGAPALNQVNIRVPGEPPPGSAVPVRMFYLHRTSNEVTVGIR